MEPTIQERLKKIDDIYALVLSHDDFFKKIDADTLLILISNYKENEDFKKISTRYARKVGVISAGVVGLATLIGALIIIKDFIATHLKL